MNNDDFKEKITGIVDNRLPNLTKEGYKVAQERSIQNIGKELKKIYEELLSE